MTSRQAAGPGCATRGAQVLASSLFALGILEVGLRVGAAVAGHRRSSPATVEGKQVILTLGDSHTYGVYYPAEDSYPGHLQARLGERAPDRYQVVNVGLPGMNSSEVAAALPEWMARYRPAATVVCVGLNNAWNRSAVADGWPRGYPFRALRLLDLARFRWRTGRSERRAGGRPELERSTHSGAVEHRDAVTGRLLARHERRHADLALAASRDLLLRDLDRMDAIHRSWGVRMILLTYAATPMPGLGRAFTRHRELSDAIVSFARKRSLELVDPRGVFAARIGDLESRNRFFHSTREGHPNADGYRLIGELVAARLERQGGSS